MVRAPSAVGATIAGETSPMLLIARETLHASYWGHSCMLADGSPQPGCRGTLNLPSANLSLRSAGYNVLRL